MEILKEVLMKKRITIVCLAASLLIFLQVIGIEEAILNFVLVGELPGMDTLIPPTGMLTLWSVVALGIGTFIMAKKRNQQLARLISEIRRHLPRRRFTQL